MLVFRKSKSACCQGSKRLPEHCLHSVAYIQLSFLSVALPSAEDFCPLHHVRSCHIFGSTTILSESFGPSNPSAHLKCPTSRTRPVSRKVADRTAVPTAHNSAMGDERCSSPRRLNEPSVTGLSVLVEPERPTLE